MRIWKLIVIAIILTILVFPAGMLIENYHPLNGMSWSMVYGNPQFNMVSKNSGPTNFKNISIYNGFIGFPHNNILNQYVIYNDIFINLGVIGNYNFFNKSEETYFNISIMASNIHNALWNFTQLHPPLFKLNYYTFFYVYEPLVYRNTVYFTGTDGHLYALDLKGNLLWEKYIGPSFFTYIFPDGNSLYLFGINFISYNNSYYFTGDSIYKINLENEQILWNTTIGGWLNLTTDHHGIIIPTYWNNILYLPLENTLYIINGSNGKAEILTRYSQNFTYLPLTYADNALFGEFNNSVVKIDIKNGNILWRYNVSDPSPCTIYNNKVVFATAHGYTYALDENTGKEIWKTYTQLGVGGPVTISANQIVYEGGADREPGGIIFPAMFFGIVALDLNDGKILDYVGTLTDGISYIYIETQKLPFYLSPLPAFYIIYVPRDNVVSYNPMDCFLSDVFVGYISHYYIWISSILIIWIPTIAYIIIKRRHKK
ncbi:MAG: PQQ-binding-like beta-propeller repeat protein [Thermoplasmata archaeon]